MTSTSWSKPLIVMCALGAGALVLSSPLFDYPHGMLLSAFGLMFVWSSVQYLPSKLGAFSPVFLLSLSAVLYSVPVSLTIAAGWVLSARRAATFNYELTGFTSWLFAVSLLAMLCGAMIGARRGGLRRSGFFPRFDRLFTRHRVSIGHASIAGLIIGVGFVLVFIYLSGGIGAITSLSYGERYLNWRGNEHYLASFNLITVCAVVAYVAGSWAELRIKLGVTRLLVLAVPLGIMVGWLMISQRRVDFFQMILPLLAVRHILMKRFSTLTLLGMGILAISGALYVSLWRGGVTSLLGHTQLDWASFNPGNAELSAPFYTTVDIVEYVINEGNFEWGWTYFLGILLLVPRVLWESRPLGLPQWYAMEFYPEMWNQGSGFASSHVAEGYLNFGLLGVILFFTAMGYWMRRLGDVIQNGRYPGGFSVSIYVLMVPYLVMFYRYDFGSFLKAYGLLTFMLCMLVVIVGSTLGKRGR